MEVIVTIVSKLGYFTYLWDVNNLLIEGLGHPVSKYQQDIPVVFQNDPVIPGLLEFGGYLPWTRMAEF